MKPVHVILSGGVVALAIWAAPAAFADAKSDAQATITKFIEAFNKGDTAAAAATHTADAHIIDEFAPHFWGGMKALDGWSADFDKNAKAKGITEPSVAISKPTRTVIDADSAYVIVPSVYTYKEKGVAMIEKGQMTFVLTKASAGWKILAWTWSGPDPKPVAKKKAK